MNRGERLAGPANSFNYTAVVPTTRPAADYTPRLIPQHAGAFVPLEAPFILWYDARILAIVDEGPESLNKKEESVAIIEQERSLAEAELEGI
jgi:hypothetical protein